MLSPIFQMYTLRSAKVCCRLVRGWYVQLCHRSFYLGESMQLDARAVAQEIATAAPYDMPAVTVEQLAWALTQGRGIAISATHRFALLQDVFSAHEPGTRPFTPTLVAAEHPPSSSRRRKARTFRDVVGFFAQTVPANIELPVNHHQISVVPSLAIVPLGGYPSSTELLQTAHGVHTLMTYDLNQVPLGEIITHVDAANTVTVYQRIGPRHFAIAQFDGHADVVNLPVVLHRVCQRYEDEITGFAPVEGAPTLLRPPPSEPDAHR